MCRCCQSCWEDCYWSCIEEKFCYDETIAYYNPDEDVNSGKLANGYIDDDENVENNNGPICVQPLRVQRNFSTISSKIHEDDYHREIQTNVPILAPEILSVFANSQIFHDHGQKTTGRGSIKPKTQSPTVHRKPKESDTVELLARLEGIDTTDSSKKIAFILNSSQELTTSQTFPPIKEEESDTEDVQMRSKEDIKKDYLRPENKILKHVQSAPYLNYRPASENDIFTISTSFNQFSMTPEVPAISFSTLPKSYLDTPTIEKYRESVSLYSIQSAKIRDGDLSMPRYFRKSDMIVNSTESLPSTVTPTSSKRAEKSKRLKNIRSNLPPLMIIGKDKNRDKEKGMD